MRGIRLRTKYKEKLDFHWLYLRQMKLSHFLHPQNALEYPVSITTDICMSGVWGFSRGGKTARSPCLDFRAQLNDRQLETEVGVLIAITRQRPTPPAGDMSLHRSGGGMWRALACLCALKIAIVSPTANLSTNVNAEVTRDSVVVAPTAISVPEKLVCLLLWTVALWAQGASKARTSPECCASTSQESARHREEHHSNNTELRHKDSD
ncbi:hypothetical protein AVEN_251647-1 [Araneus ventricosus]|uniref:Uncharacterized protein n=1 Tax=Araneus ventricosus TaxID=182803 RepID=A0A4Y2FUA5_ARAVE|nr:hypothetical protein AVEN_251647-1 [Araneus ventricosus]